LKLEKTRAKNFVDKQKSAAEKRSL